MCGLLDGCSAAVPWIPGSPCGAFPGSRARRPIGTRLKIFQPACLVGRILVTSFRAQIDHAHSFFGGSSNPLNKEGSGMAITCSRQSVLLALACLCVAPASALAQSTFTGVVKDASGAVLPGVTVEAASPVLIEKTRSVVTDPTGGYRLTDLRPGVYTITFALAGFSTVKREALELPANFTMTINSELKVGALEETVTVAGRRRWSTSRAPRNPRSSTGMRSTRSRPAARFKAWDSSSRACR